MPNWCSNTLTISVVNSDKESIEQLNTFMVIAESGESDLSMANILRIPNDLKIECGSADMIYDACYGNWVKFVTYPWVTQFIRK